MSDRGIKKWAPYRSLPEQAPSLNNRYEKEKDIEKPLISNEIAEEINDILTNYHGQTVLITYYRNKRINKIETTIKRIDSLNRKLILEEKSISFSELLLIENL